MSTNAVADTNPELATLAARHGLSVAGARPRLGPYLRQMWAYRHFTLAYANAQVVASFSRARLGRLWQVLTPLSNATVYYLIFGVVLDTKRGVPNFIAYLCTGLFVFNFTQTVVLTGTTSIASNLNLIRALHFPRACLPIATTMLQLQHLFASIAVLVVIVVATGEPVTLNWLLLIPATLLQAMFNAGLALLMARLGSKLTDLKQIMPFVMRTWMYGSGVLYNVDNFAKHLPWPWSDLVRLNPLLTFIELARHALLASSPLASPPLFLWLTGAGWAVVLGTVGFVFFWRGEREYGRG
jgi:teichoic acid transport system permease protein